MIDSSNTPIVAIDPGRTTGLAWYACDKIYWKELGPEAHHDDLKKFLDVIGPQHVVIERFDERGNMAADRISLEYVGVVKTWVQDDNKKIRMRPGSSLTEQGVSDAKTLWPDKKLRKLQIELPPRSPAHTRDALRHLLMFMQKTLHCMDYVILATAPGDARLSAEGKIQQASSLQREIRQRHNG